MSLGESNLVERLIEKHGNELRHFEDIIAFATLMIYTTISMGWKEIKKQIDQFGCGLPVKQPENNELFNLAGHRTRYGLFGSHIERSESYSESLDGTKRVLDKLDNESLVYDIKLRQKFANKLVTVYRDLLETIGGLFSDMMDNNLNHLMKYLDSAALVVCSAIIDCWTLGDQHWRTAWEG